ncbi:uncharacterized protein LOC120108702 [Phoenix dactylifera]|uniref:Uncharacterized protein LOC120108702 n=1 Tax=Phoenix dactylifera TaxID=42345 RepID=A0A8B8ZY77_PHODC|nr:uncharacterized protein LOC120108702 [Phoenix dactylifera]
MGCREVVLVLVALQATTTILLQRAAAGDFLAPLLAPVINATCDNVECGKGTCKPSLNYTFGFLCECNPSWSQFYNFSSSPCVIPNCSINYSCSNHSEAPAPSPAPPPNTSIFDSCFWSYCGGGKCVKTSTFEHRCECEEGFSNLLNITSFPCYRDCSLGADCAELGITLSNATTPSSPPSLSDNGSSFAGDSFAPNNLLWLFILMISLIIV